MKKLIKYIKQLKEQKKLTKTDICLSALGLLLFLTLLITLPFINSKNQNIIKSQAADALLFKSGFESDTLINAPSNGWQMISGTDNSTGYSWSAPLWGGTFGIQDLTASYDNQIKTVIGHTGASTKALFQSMNNLNDWQSQVPLIWSPTNSLSQQSDLYTSSWLYLQPDLASQLVPGQLNGFWGNWRFLWEWKTGLTGAQYGGDFRTFLGIAMDNNGNLGWQAGWDTAANGPLAMTTFWSQYNYSVPVPVGQWFRLETFTHRANTSGRWWAKVNGQTVFDHSGTNLGSGVSYCSGPCPINRVFLSQNYTNGHVPAWQYVDDLEIWNGVPMINTPTPTTIPTSTSTPPTLTPAPNIDTTPPTVTITSPTNGSTISRRSNVTITATASDNVGVTKLEFYVNSILKCTDTTVPYSCVWSVPNAKNVQYTLTAKAYDAKPNTNTGTITVTAK